MMYPKRVVSFACLVAFVSCNGSMARQDQVSSRTIRLVANADEGLQIKACLDANSPDDCPEYVNAFECKTMDVYVDDNGKTTAYCQRANGGESFRIGGGIAAGISVLCGRDKERDCLRCEDPNGIPLLDECEDGTVLYKSINMDVNVGDGTTKGGGLAQNDTSIQQNDDDDSDGERPPATPSTKDTSSGDTSDICSPSWIQQQFAVELNTILAKEDFGCAEFTPGDGQMRGWFSWRPRDADQDICEHWEEKAEDGHHLTETWTDDGFCKKEKKGNVLHVQCKCGRIDIAAVRAICSAMASSCDKAAQAELANEIARQFGRVVKWINEGAKSGSIVPEKVKMKCLGSPLVFDMNGDGIHLKGVDSSTRFDLFAAGTPQNTAWIQGDDALLVLDANNNGLIDDGTELVGEFMGGIPNADGFVALARFDRRDFGGNEDGSITADDLAYYQLQLWNDRNGDGQSQNDELVTLSDSNIDSIDLKKRYEEETDQHGNDLSLKGRFKRASDKKSHTIIDVQFLTE